MTKVLKITKPDKTVHVAPLATKSRVQAYNNRLPANLKWKIEEVEEEEAKKLPFIDKNYVSGAEAQVKVSELQKESAVKDTKIAELEAELAAKKAGRLPADLLVSLLATASKEQIEVLIKDDDRKTVKEAAEKRLTELAAAQ